MLNFNFRHAMTALCHIYLCFAGVFLNSPRGEKIFSSRGENFIIVKRIFSHREEKI